MRKALFGIATFVCLLCVCYASLPWLVNALVLPRVVDQLGLDSLSLEMGYPGFNSLHLSELHLEDASIRLDAINLQLSYDLDGLGAGRIENLEVEQVVLEVRQTGSDRSAEPENGTVQPGTSQSASPESLLARVPAERVSVERLEVRVPSMDFAARGRLSLDEAGLAAELSGIRPEIARDLNASIDIGRTGILGLSVQDPDPEAPSSIHLSAEPGDTRLAVQGAFSVTGYGLALLQELGGLPAGSGKVTGELATSLPWPLADLPTWRTLTATARVNLNWSLAEPRVELNDMVASIELVDGSLTVTPAGEAGFAADDLRLTGTFGGGSFAYRDGRITSEDPRLNLSVEAADWTGEAGVRSVRMTLTAPFDVAVTSSLTVVHEATQLTGTLNATLTEVDQLFTGTFGFDGSADASALLDLPNLQLEDYPLQLEGDYTLDGSRLDASARLSTASLNALPFRLEHNLDSADGTLSFSHTQTISEPLLHRLLPGWQEPYDLDGGELDLSGKLAWGERLNGALELRPRAITAHYDDYTLINTGGVLNLTLADSDLSLLPSDLSIEAIDVGLPVTDVELTLSGTLDILTVSHATAHLLGGRASAAPFDYEIESGTADITVALSDIDLAQILALEGEKVSGTGSLSGTIPVALRNNTLHIEGGAVTASIPGRIMLSPSLTASITQPGLDIAFKALENFNYEALGVNVNYDDEGNMQLSVRLEGRNPDLENGRPVHFNLNISENIPVLLKSLRLQDNFTKTLERRITQ